MRLFLGNLTLPSIFLKCSLIWSDTRIFKCNQLPSQVSQVGQINQLRIHHHLAAEYLFMGVTCKKPLVSGKYTIQISPYSVSLVHKTSNQPQGENENMNSYFQEQLGITGFKHLSNTKPGEIIFKCTGLSFKFINLHRMGFLKRPQEIVKVKKILEE